MPWEPVPEKTLQERFDALQRDFTTCVLNTCFVVQSSHASLDGIRMNVPRASELPEGVAYYQDGTTVKFRNIGMPQPGCHFGTLADLLKIVADAATEEGLQL